MATPGRQVEPVSFLEELRLARGGEGGGFLVAHVLPADRAIALERVGATPERVAR